MLRVDAIRARILKIEEINGVLDPMRRMGREEWEQSPLLVLAAERGLQVGAEAILDIGNHVLAGHWQESPGSNEEVIRRLARHDVLSPATATRLAGIGGFRNVLVHGYVGVRSDLVWEALQRSRRDFEAFVGDVVTWLEAK